MENGSQQFHMIQPNSTSVCVLSHFSHVQLFVTLWTMACQAPLSMGILQARILEWVAMPSSRGSSQPEGSNTYLWHWQVGWRPGPVGSEPLFSSQWEPSVWERDVSRKLTCTWGNTVSWPCTQPCHCGHLGLGNPLLCGHACVAEGC